MLLDKGIPFGYIFKKVWRELVFTAMIGFLAYYFAHFFREEIPPMPIQIPAFLGTAISVILSFKLNQSYDRWWEARKVWGAIVNDSRSLVLQLQSFVSGDDKAVRQIALRQIAWCYALGRSLRGLNPLENLTHLADSGDLEKAATHTNRPLALLQLNSLQIAGLKQAGQLDTFQQVQINNTIVNLTNSMGMAERIKSTVFPATYRLFLHLFIYLFVVTLSISLGGIDMQYEIPLLLIISSVFFLLEKTATHLQDPFSNKPTDTAMTAIATTIEINLKQLIGAEEVPGPKTPDGFYLM